MTRWPRHVSLALLVATLGAAPGESRGQPAPGAGMPNLRAISGRPLPDPGMAAGTISVRVARKIPANGVANAEITAIVEAPGGEARKRSAKTDTSGRAVFEAVPAGHRFHAEVVVDGEKLSTETFPVPESGGIRTMLIAALPADGGEADGPGAGDGQPPRKAFSLGFIAGVARLDPTLPTGVVDVLALDQQGRPIDKQALEIGRVMGPKGVEVSEAVTGADGRARFSNLLPAETGGAGGAGGGIAAAVVMDHAGQRISTEGFQLPERGGVSVELRVPEVTSDPSTITLAEGGRVIMQLREEGLSFIETFQLENRTAKVFDPGVGGVEIPLPKEAVGAEGAEGSHKIEIRKGIGVAVHGAIPPRRLQDPSGKSPDEVTFGFLLPTRSATRDFEQRFPNGVGEYTFATEQIPGIVIDSPQITGRQDREFGGKKYWLMRGEPIPPGGLLRFTVRGLPAPDPTGRVVSGALALGLMAGAVVFGRRRGRSDASKEQATREKLIERREQLFAGLVAAEKKRSGAGDSASPASAAAAKTERDELVRKLEGVYRELAALDDQRPA